MSISKVEHLTKEEIIKNGSIFTPNYLVNIVYSMVRPYIKKDSTVIDFGTGYGSFLVPFVKRKHKKIIATDSDKKSIEYVKNHYKNVKVICENSLSDVKRSKYAFNKDEIIVIGNPPYNDTTSIYRKGEKGKINVDDDIFARDLGVSFLRMYCKINSKYICVLHPLSYLIKKTNFNSLKEFNKNYTLKRGILFSSSNFESINKSNLEFPVVAALYKRTKQGMDYDYISKFEFEILNSKDTFILSNYKTINGIIEKYPTKDKKDDDLQFYTIRDINALKRNKTFLTGHCNNGIKVNKENLLYYCYLDLFKSAFSPNDMYLFGNLPPLFTSEIEKEEIKKQLFSYSLNTNAVLNAWIKNNDVSFYKKYHSVKYDYQKLSRIINKTIEV